MIIPLDNQIQSQNDFFVNNPEKMTAKAIRLQEFRDNLPFLRH